MNLRYRFLKDFKISRSKKKKLWVKKLQFLMIQTISWQMATEYSFIAEYSSDKHFPKKISEKSNKISQFIQHIKEVFKRINLIFITDHIITMGKK